MRQGILLLALAYLAGHAAAQVTVTTSMVELSLTNTQPVFGTLEGYGTILQVPLGSPTPPGGTITFLNGTQVLATTNLASGVLVINGNNVTVNGTDPTPLPLGTYNQFQTSYSGFSQTTAGVTTTWTASTSRAPVIIPFLSFTVVPITVGLNLGFQQFSIANFAQAFQLNVTNADGTNIPPQGPTFETFFNTDTGALIGNYTLVYTQLNNNTLQANLPASFNATQLFAAGGNFSTVFTFVPTSPDFAQPNPLTVFFSFPVPPPPSSTIPTQITSLSLNNTRLVYGQQELFGTRIQVAAGSPVPQGSITFFNGSTVLASGSLTGPGAVVSGNGVTLNVTSTSLLLPGFYSLYQTSYPGFSVTDPTTNITTTWGSSSSSTSGTQSLSFSVAPASVGLSFAFTSFTLSNFSQSFFLNVTNLNQTGIVPGGPTFEVITNTDTGKVIGNYTLVYTQLNANTLAASLPSSFNATQTLGFGNYSAVFYYAGTNGFGQTVPLTVQFAISNRTVPSPPVPQSPSPPPPSPGVLPPPPPPIVGAPPPPPPGSPGTPFSGVYQTVTQLEVYFEKQKEFLKTCKSANLVFTAAVTGPNKTLVPKTGYVDFTLVPSGTEIGQAGIIADPTLGLASVTIIKKPGSSGVYGIPPAGAYTVMASYSGSINGTFGASSASTTFVVSEDCAGYSAGSSCQSCASSCQTCSSGLLSSIGSSWNSLGSLNSLTGSLSSLNSLNSLGSKTGGNYDYSNGYSGNFPPGSFYNGNNQPYTSAGAVITPQGCTSCGQSSYTFQVKSGGQPKV